MLPHGCRRAESGQHGDLLDRAVGRLQQLLAARQPFAEQPRAERVPGQLTEMPGEGPAAHQGLRRQAVEGMRLVEARPDPVEQIAKARVAAARR